MLSLQTSVMPGFFSPLCAVNTDSSLLPFSSFNIQNPSCRTTTGFRHSGLFLPYPKYGDQVFKPFLCLAVPRKSDSNSEPSSNPEAKPEARSHQLKTEASRNEDQNPSEKFPTTIPRKPRRGRRSEAAAVEDFIRDSLQNTFASIQQQNSEILENKENIMKDIVHEEILPESSDDDDDDDDDDEDEEDEMEKDVAKGRGKNMVVEEESSNWPVDADVGWGIRASEYFEQHSIKNVVGDDGVEIDWEGEIDDNWVQEINCLEWESFAFHPSPLIVLVFERYRRATDNWKNLKELEKAIKVYWSAKDRLPPRAVKIDINIERDLAYALKVRDCPQILFLRGNSIFYRERELRTADELVQMIAFFYYNAKKPSWIDDKALTFRF